MGADNFQERPLLATLAILPGRELIYLKLRSQFDKSTTMMIPLICDDTHFNRKNLL